jgi:N-acetylmuramoyl-L-alanine amidase
MPQQQPARQEEQQKSAPEFLVIIDPSHGGEDKGAHADKLTEKEVTLAFARELRKELDELGIASLLLRETDIDLPLQKRAEIANGHRNGIYVAIHAGLTGQGSRIYCATLLPPAAAAGPFVPWSNAQSLALPRSRLLAKAVVGEIQKKKLHAVGLNAPLRPLNNILAPAIAIELALKSGDPRAPENLKIQNAVAIAVAAGIATSRGQMGVRP